MSTAAVKSPDTPTGGASRATRSPRAVDVACRILDLLVATATLLLLLPVMLMIAVAIRIESRGPVLFRQRRIGRDQTPFTVNKFRTMHRGASHKVHQEFVLSLIAGEVPAQGDDGPALQADVGSARHPGRPHSAQDEPR